MLKNKLFIIFGIKSTAFEYFILFITLVGAFLTILLTYLGYPLEALLVCSLFTLYPLKKTKVDEKIIKLKWKDQKIFYKIWTITFPLSAVIYISILVCKILFY